MAQDVDFLGFYDEQVWTNDDFVGNYDQMIGT